MSKYIMFDFDGTIADSRNVVMQVYNELAEKYGFRKANEEEMLSMSNLSLKERGRYMGISLFQIPQLVVEAKRKLQNFTDSLSPFRGMKDLILDLKEKGLNLSIVSSNSKPGIEKFLSKNSLNVFDHIHTSNNLFGKHYIFNSMIRNHQLKRKDIIYIGDETRDIDSSRKAGIKIIAVSWGFDTQEMLLKHSPDYLVNTPSEILDIIDQQT